MSSIKDMPVLSCAVCVVGAGAAGLNAADELKRAGVDVLLVADSFSGGTSLNAGSDKQTYYKLSLAGGSPDSVAELAQSFFQGGGMHGDHAYAMAALSARSFYKLVQLGVPFPHNEWGEYIGYKTDHDERQRATSAGPLTSKMMGEALMRSARARGVRMRDGVELISILKDNHGRACGLLARDMNRADRPYLLINAHSIILCTGGAALAYHNTVYPDAQCGATGAALRAGALANNLCYWQYGLASKKVKWNVSGSYQQAIPAYTDGATPILRPYFDGERDMINSVFLKGYQWPFDARKLNGSSRVDQAVHAHTNAGGKVYMDFRREMAQDVLALLDDEARTYLNNCGALTANPYARLEKINAQAIAFYASHGIELRSEPLEVAVCAQHSNGGVAIDAHWRTAVDGLYAAGECAGAFGIYRPGGSALNETQAGALRAARYIMTRKKECEAHSEEDFTAAVADDLRAELAWLEMATHGQDGTWTAAQMLENTRRDMDGCAGAVRSVSGMKALAARISKNMDVLNTPPACPQSIEDVARLRDTLHMQQAMLSAMICQSEYAGEAGHTFIDRQIMPDAREARHWAFETQGGYTRAVPLRPMPDGGGWFETVWAEYLQGQY